MSDQTKALATLDRNREVFTFSALAEELRTAALERGALIGKVTNADEQVDAVAALQEVNGVLALAEKTRKEFKEPIISMGKLIDSKAKEYSTPLLEEKNRLNQIVADFQALEEARIRAAQQAENERLKAIEREKMKELAEAKDHDEFDAIQEKYAEQAAAASANPPPTAARAEGQQVKSDWDITVTNIHDLYRSHPNCVKMEARLTEIKNLLNAGVKVAGIHAVQKKVIIARGKVNLPVTV